MRTEYKPGIGAVLLSDMGKKKVSMGKYLFKSNAGDMLGGMDYLHHLDQNKAKVPLKEGFNKYFYPDDEINIYEMYSSLFYNSNEIVYLHDFDGNFMDINPFGLKVLGYDKQDIKKLNFYNILTKNQKEKVRRAFDEIKKSGRMLHMAEFRITGKEGRDVYVEAMSHTVYNKGKPYAIQGIARDITDRKQAIIDLEKREEKWRCMVNNIPEYIYCIEYNGGEVDNVYHSPKCLEITGYSQAEYRDDPFLWSRMIHRDDSHSVTEFVNKLKRAGATGSIDHRIYHKDGTVRWLSNTCTIQRDPEGNLRSQTGFILDITERKNFEEKLNRSIVIADSANRAKSEFLANMSHELRTPLNGILGFCQILLMEKNGPMSEKQGKLVRSILDCGKHLLEMVNDILDLAKIEAGKIELNKKPFSIQQLLNRSLSSIKAISMEKRINIEYSITSELGWINADEVRIKQVMYNLLSNAIKFTEPGNSVGIKTAILGDKIMITVWDEGLGIPEEYLERIFDPFEQVKREGHEKQSGTGLGLSITRKLVEMHDGSIKVESTPGRGSCFIVTLPERIDFGIQPEEKESLLTAHTHNYHPKKSQILVVEDNKINIDVLRDALENSSWSIDYALTGEEALEYVEVKTYDIILMDIQLPGINGIEVMKRIKGSEQDKKKKSVIIALTAYAMKGDWEKFINEGFDDYVSKPVDIESLLIKMKNHLIKSNILNTLSDNHD